MLNNCPFSLKETLHDPYTEGVVFQLPKFCSKNISQGKCKSFYRKILKNKQTGLIKCPYGLMIDGIYVNESFKILIGLNIEKFSDRRMTRKLLNKNTDFLPMLKFNDYSRIRQSYITAAQINMQDLYEKQINDLKIERTELIDNKEIINNHLHEIRKLNSQLKSQADHLMFCRQNIESSDVVDYVQRVFSTSQLISVRLDTYDACNNMGLVEMEQKIPTNIFKKVEKAFHCLRSSKNVPSIYLNQSSYLKFNLSRSFELLPFILIENSIKYSLREGYDTTKKKIDIFFYENNNSLRVKFRNWGPRPKEDEVPFLMDRSRRSIHVQNDTEGHGLGLFIAKKIAEHNNIKMDIYIGNETFYDSKKTIYSPFCVELSFENLKPVETY